MSFCDLQKPDKGGTKSKDYMDGTDKPTNLSDFVSKPTMMATGAPVPTRHTDDQWIQQGFTTKSFSALHKYVFPIIDKTTSQEHYQEHVFTKEWNAMKHPPKLMDYLKLQRDMQWNSAKVLFKDLNGYKSYINTYPEICNYVTLKTNKWNKSKLDLPIHKWTRDTAAIAPDKNDDSNGTKTTDESQEDQDITVPYISHYLDEEWDTESREDNGEDATSLNFENNQAGSADSTTTDLIQSQW
jgi:hypothetical protein